MIDAIEIENFQSHKETSIQLHPGVNVIKGKSHSGKSSIMRALRWALLNQPRGAHFVSHFKGKKEETSVAIGFNDGRFILRKKGPGENGYELSDHEPLPSIRTDLPEEVTDITNLNEINIQTQGEPYFMLNKTSGQVGRELNSIVGLDIIDETFKKINVIENQADGKKSVLTEQIEKEGEELKELSFVDDLEDRVITLEELWKKFNKILVKKANLSDMVEKIEECDSDLKIVNEWLSIITPYNEIKEMIDKQSSLSISCSNLKKLIHDYDEAEKVWHSADKSVAELNKKLETILNSEEYKNQFCECCGAHQEHWDK